MRIGIDISGFTSLIGACDFINNIIIALSNNAKKNGDELFIITHANKNFYKNFKGIKKIFYKIIYFFKTLKGYKIIPNTGYYSCFKNLTILEISRNYKKIIQKFKIDCVLPITDPQLNLTPVPIIRYLYDCQHKYYPQFFSENDIKNRDNYFQEMIKNFCIVNSEDTKNDLIKFYNADKNKIFALPFSPKLKNEYIIKNKPEIIEKYKLPNKYFLMSCQFWVHKDHKTLLKAFAKLAHETNFSDINLVLTGTMEEPRKPEYINELKTLIKQLNIKNKVYLLGCIPKEEQLEIMKKAIAVINTTLFEGGPGGGSVWDACALGIRSIISDIKVNLEINNDLVSFFKTSNADDLCKKMIQLLQLPPPKYETKILINKTSKNIDLLGNSLYKIINTVINKNKDNNYE